ncbi:MAG TPA: alpha/beta fold hydrolase [Allosphingosinicella sp.]|nr:alpha/beta fold hydrolase [Allosphingosinicella sp.]
MAIHHVRRGSGKPLILVHGLGSSRKSWGLIGLALAEQREVISVDLPGHGDSPAEADSTTFAGIVRSFDEWLTAEKLAGADMVGSSMGGRVVLEMARRGRAGAVVALDPGGFWEGWERQYVYGSLIASAALLRSLGPALPLVAHNAAARTAILAQLSHRPWALPGDLVENELAGIAATTTFDPLLRDLAFGELQEGPAAPGSGRVTIGWGRHDRLLLPVQATRACAAFPGARLHWFDHSGHFPMLDEPDATVALIRSATV